MKHKGMAATTRSSWRFLDIFFVVHHFEFPRLNHKCDAELFITINYRNLEKNESNFSSITWSNTVPADSLVPFDVKICLLWRKSKESPKLRVTGLREGNSSVTGDFPAQGASNAEKIFPFDDVIMSY